MKRGTFALFLMLIALVIDGCGKQSIDSPTDRKEFPKSVDEMVSNCRRFTVWTTYWDTGNLEKTMENIKENIDGVCYFAAYFNEKQEPFIPKATLHTYDMINTKYQDAHFTSYLTFVNDVQKPDGSNSLKDTEILYSLFSDSKTMESHVNEIILMTMEEGFDGIEIDYEAIKEDEKLWKLYIQFIKKLYEKSRKEGLLVRIVLEPNTPTKKILFPKGPEYVMMCYNLHGYGTKPGPKATPDFLKAMVTKMKDIPGKKNFAVATGGFDFGEDNSVKAITEVEARQLEEEYKQVSSRDEKSQSLVFHYEEAGISHEVWYGDKRTIEFWFDEIESFGDYELSLWRLGGNYQIDY